MKHKIMLIVLTLTVLAGCQSLKNLSPTEVLQNSIEQPDQIQYYGESETKMTLDDDYEAIIKTKEWRNDDKLRVELDDGEHVSVSITNGAETLSYADDSQHAFITDLATGEYSLTEPKDEMDNILEELFETHTVKRVGEETVAKRKTFHLLATPQDDSNETVYDIWIDKQYWVMLKMAFKNEDMHYKMEFTSIDFKPKFDEDIFLLEAPPGYETSTINDSEGKESVSLDQVVEAYGKDFFYFPTNDDFKLTNINREEYGELGSEDSFVEYVFQYEKDGEPFLDLSIYPKEEEEIPFEFGDDYSFEVRNTTITIAEDTMFLSWKESGYVYLLDYYDRDITVQQLEDWIKAMINPS